MNTKLALWHIISTPSLLFVGLLVRSYFSPLVTLLVVAMCWLSMRVAFCICVKFFEFVSLSDGDGEQSEYERKAIAAKNELINYVKYGQE